MAEERSFFDKITNVTKSEQKKIENLLDNAFNFKQYADKYGIGEALKKVEEQKAEITRKQAEQKGTDGNYSPPSAYDISGAAHWHNMADIGICVHRNFEEDKTIIYLKKVREQGLYGDIGEALFTYNIETKNYSEVREEPQNTQYWND